MPDETAREAKIAAIFACLREEVRRGAAPHESGSAPTVGAPAARARARGEAERLWPISFDKPPQRRPGLRGTLFHPIKVVLAKLMRWYVEPAASDQRGVNQALLSLIDDLEERLSRLEAAGPDPTIPPPDPQDRTAFGLPPTTPPPDPQDRG